MSGHLLKGKIANADGKNYEAEEIGKKCLKLPLRLQKLKRQN